MNQTVRVTAGVFPQREQIVPRPWAGGALAGCTREVRHRARPLVFHLGRPDQHRVLERGADILAEETKWEKRAHGGKLDHGLAATVGLDAPIQARGAPRLESL